MIFFSPRNYIAALFYLELPVIQVGEEQVSVNKQKTVEL